MDEKINKNDRAKKNWIKLKIRLLLYMQFAGHTEDLDF